MLTKDTSIEFIKGIGKEKAKFIHSVLNLSTVGDLLEFYPIRYIDKSKVYSINEINPNEQLEIQLKGKIFDLQEVKNGKIKRLSAKFTDGTGEIDLVWFKYSNWMVERIPLGKEVYLFGKIGVFNQRYQMAHPEIELAELKEKDTRLRPIYPSSEKLTKRGLGQKFFQKILAQVCAEIPQLIEENLPTSLLQSFKLMPRIDAYINIHFPVDFGQYQQAERRLKFEEAFFFQLSYALKKKKHSMSAIGNPFPIVGEYFNRFYTEFLPFELTSAQKRVIKEIRTDMKRPIQMNRLLQGDVGSGKTMVALLSMLIAIDNGFQAVLMAPTEILAQQHFNGISQQLQQVGVNVKLLTGSTKTSERKVIHEQLLSGELSVLIGTHAVLEDVVQFKKLGLAIIDEQHRFGVAQRAKLWAKNKIPPHILVMTATPIPRTLAMSLYSDLDISITDELPQGRKPIITAHKREQDRLSVFRFVKEELEKGRQIYFVYPLIQESESLDYKNLMEGFEHVSEYFKDYNVTMVHGKMKPAEKDENMRYFASGKAHIMVATTVIEVGVNVPNASVMVIESAERFGLSQLHQLRGRVGRGAEQSFCILMSSDKLSAEGRKRIKTMCETNDGFKISEVDMQLRGPGDILGTQQSGVVDFKKLNLSTDFKIIKASKDIVEQIVNNDPLLSHPDHQIIKKYYMENYSRKHSWSKIS